MYIWIRPQECNKDPFERGLELKEFLENRTFIVEMATIQEEGEEVETVVLDVTPRPIDILLPYERSVK